METNNKVEAALNNIRPALQMDGGDVELVKFEDGVVYVKLLGACGGCPMSTMTLKLFIEERLKEEVPEVTEVVSV
ncbi:MAG: NifU family protein [Acidobacteria bacterium]|nr:NifU family protein [Acidobacteriota bacterium]